MDHFESNIKDSIKNSKIYVDPTNLPKNKYDRPTSITFLNMDSSDAVYDTINKYGGGYNTAVLDFASYVYPGGGFDKGYMAQEEDLCHNSTLYNILSSDELSKWYQHQEYKDKINNFLYHDTGIYIPNVVFNSDNYDPVTCDVIVVAAPYAKKAMKTGVKKNRLDEAILNRVYTVLKMASDNDVEVLILGAFGCGVFRCDPMIVAYAFKEAIMEFKYDFKEIVFAIPKKSNSVNYNTFKEIIK